MYSGLSETHAALIFWRWTNSPSVSGRLVRKLSCICRNKKTCHYNL